MVTRGTIEQPQTVPAMVKNGRTPESDGADGPHRRAGITGSRAFGRRFLRALVLLILAVLVSVGVAWGAWHSVVALSTGTLGGRAIPTVFGPLFIIVLALSAAAGEERAAAELAPLLLERRQLNARLDDSAGTGIRGVIQLNLNQLSEYYLINKRQARNSYNLSLLALGIGSTVIIAGLVSLSIRALPDPRVSVFTTLAGSFLEVVGGACFVMYRRSLEQVNLFFHQLTRMQDTMLAIELAGELPDQRRRGAVIERVIAALLERSLAPTVGVILTDDGAGTSNEDGHASKSR